MSTNARRRALVVTLFATALTAQTAPAASELSRLTAKTIRTSLPHQAVGEVAPGDVLLRNDFLRVVVKATSGRPDAPVGTCLVWTAYDSFATPLKWTPGPVREWQSAEVGSSRNLSVVRLGYAAGEWSAQLTYSLGDNSPWLDVSVSVTNADSKRVLEIPLADRIHASGPVTRRQNAVFVGGAGAAAAIVPRNHQVSPVEVSAGQWVLTRVSGDPQSSSLKRFGRRLLFFRKSRRPYSPSGLDDGLPREARDHDDWYRLEPGHTRELTLRLVAGASSDEARSLSEHAAGKSPAPSIRPTPTIRPTPSTAPAPKVAAPPRPKRIVGKLRTTPSPADNASVQSSTSAKPPAGLIITPAQPDGNETKSDEAQGSTEISLPEPPAPVLPDFQPAEEGPALLPESIRRR